MCVRRESKGSLDNVTMEFSQGTQQLWAAQYFTRALCANTYTLFVFIPALEARWHMRCSELKLHTLSCLTWPKAALDVTAAVLLMKPKQRERIINYLAARRTNTTW